MARVTIGEDTYDIPELNFIAVERAWPLMVEAQEEADPMKAVSAAIGAIAAGIMESPGFDAETYGAGRDNLDPKLDFDDQVHVIMVAYLKKRLKATQIGQVRLALNDIVGEAGLLAEEGELIAPGEATASLSPETAPQPSLNSSQPDAREEAGTA